MNVLLINDPHARRGLITIISSVKLDELQLRDKDYGELVVLSHIPAFTSLFALDSSSV